MGWFLSFLPRKWLQDALYLQWRSSLEKGDRLRLDHWGATGNHEHHEFQWADHIKE